MINIIVTKYNNTKMSLSKIEKEINKIKFQKEEKNK